MNSIAQYIGIFLIVLSVFSCKREVAEADDLKKPAVTKPTVTPTILPKSTTAPAKLAWTTPASWKKAPNTSPIQAARYEISPKPHVQIQVSVTPLPGSAGGVLPNINRWRGQIGLPPIDDTNLAKICEWVPTSIGKARVISVAGLKSDSASKKVVMVAIIPYAEQTWFVKLVGAREHVDADVKKEFVEFVISIKSE